uniref:Sperm-associated antigen 1 n=1 Tax=Lutzomyia longipalpis TaxID=7200 RepID=A0A1B0CE84_LUTLO
MVKEGKKTLLEKWEIPINHLDFDYVKQCTNPKELEKIYKILQSGEEGYYPELTKCTEEHLRALKPNSKVFRTEAPVLKKDHLDQETFQQIRQNLTKFSLSAKEKEKEVEGNPKKLKIEYPEVRQPKAPPQNGGKLDKNPADRIKSHEYEKWDKYDADAEMVKMDLQEEIQKERAERQKSQKKVVIEEIVNPIWNKMTKSEREELALKHKIKGNEYFKTKDFEEAHREYSKCIDIEPSAIAYNNRAIANIKLDRLREAIEDCDACLRVEPKNLKALMRKAQALELDDCKRSALEVLQEILKIDPENAAAKKSAEKLRKEIPSPLTGAFRMKIEDIPEELPEELSEELPEVQDVDFSKLIIPNRIVKSKMAAVAQNLGKI